MNDLCKHCPVLAADGPRAKFPVLAFCALKRAGTVWPLRRVLSWSVEVPSH